MQVRKGGSIAGIFVHPVVAPVAVLRPWAATGQMAVDALVVWALRDQRADASPGGGLLELEALVDGVAFQGRTSDGCAAIERIGAVGCQIDVSPGTYAERVHPVADAVARALRQLPGGDWVAAHGRLGSTPYGWEAPTRWLVPERWEVQGERAMWTHVERREGAHCPLVQVASVEGLVAARAEWLAWWDALEALAWALSARALGFVVTGPAVPREPWLDGPRLHW